MWRWMVRSADVSINPVCRNLHDDQLTVGVQTTGSRLLSNLAEVIFKERANLLQLEQRRALLAKILVALVSKIATLRESLPSFMTPSTPVPTPPVHDWEVALSACLTLTHWPIPYGVLAVKHACGTVCKVCLEGGDVYGLITSLPPMKHA